MEGEIEGGIKKLNLINIRHLSYSSILSKHETGKFLCSYSPVAYLVL